MRVQELPNERGYISDLPCVQIIMAGPNGEASLIPLCVAMSVPFIFHIKKTKRMVVRAQGNVNATRTLGIEGRSMLR